MYNFTVLCDVDVCVAPSDKWWLTWLERVTGVKLQTGGKLNYDLTRYFKSELEYNNLTGYEFWEQEGLYDNMEPVEGSVEALEAIVELGGRLVFVSHEMGLHGLSKRRWLDKHFPFATATILTVDKGGFNSKSLVEGDYIIEDRYDGLKDFTWGATNGIILNTPYIEPKPVEIDYVVCDDWNSIKRYFEEEMAV